MVANGLTHRMSPLAKTALVAKEKKKKENETEEGKDYK